MARALDLELVLPLSGDLKLDTYHYAPQSVEFDSMAEHVFVSTSSGALTMTLEMTPDEARVLANQLLQVADGADDARRTRESYDEIREELDDSERDGTGCYYAHPWVHYVAPGGIGAKTRELDAAGVRRYIVLADPVDTAMPAEDLAEADA